MSSTMGSLSEEPLSLSEFSRTDCFFSVAVDGGSDAETCTGFARGSLSDESSSLSESSRNDFFFSGGSAGAWELLSPPETERSEFCGSGD